MIRTCVIIIALAAVGIVVASVGLKVFSPSLTGKQNVATSSAQTTSKMVESNNPLPVSPNHSAVRSAKAIYSFVGNLRAIRSYSDGSFELVTSIDGKGVPKFIVTKDTKIFLENDVQSTVD